MKILLVGGAVRDLLLNRQCNDKDYVVLHSTPEEMISLGFKRVGQNFPVFLHPKTNDEFALARKEYSIGQKHTDFRFEFTPDIPIECDLFRRDLTINAIAFDGKNYIDPFGGLNDIDNKILKHVSFHFNEDPLRVLRIARFAAQLPDFTIDDQTYQLMKLMSKRRDLNHLTGERVNKELRKALCSPEPRIFFDVLRKCDALECVFPEIHNLIGVEQSIINHPEGDAYEHTMIALTSLNETVNNKERLIDLRFSILCHDFGKAQTPKINWPKHINHEKLGIPITESFCDRLSVTSQLKKLALSVTELHMKCHRILQMTPQKILKLIKTIGGFKNQNQTSLFIFACESDDKSKNKSIDYKQGDF